MTGIVVQIDPPMVELVNRFVRGERQVHTSRRNVSHRLAGRLEQIAQDEAPKRTGEFARSIQARVFDEPDSSIISLSSAQPLGTFITRGTRPHMIFPRGNYPLRFEVGGRVVFARFVHHPGTRPNPFLDRAHDRIQPELATAAHQIASDYRIVITR